MKEMRVGIPDQLAREVDALVKGGRFAIEAEITRLALTEFLRRYRFELLERFQREDVSWTLQQREHRA